MGLHKLETYTTDSARHRAVIIGGGFAGLYAARALRHRRDIDVTLIDRNNFHLFQPLLYQVATGGISPGDISAPLRGILKKQHQTRVWQANVVDIDTSHQSVILQDGEIGYDTLVVATGVSHSYFGHDDWAKHAHGLKSIGDALNIRRRIFLAFEKAERAEDPDQRQQLMTFVVVGGGPTGVELAGAIAELAHGTLKNDFRAIDPRAATIVLIEGQHRILPTYPPDLSAHAENSLANLGVTVKKQTMVREIDADAVTIEHAGQTEVLQATTVLWAAGVTASPVGRIIARETGAHLDTAGRVPVKNDLTIAGHGNLFVIGDLAVVMQPDGTTLPGVAPVAMQQGRYVAGVIGRRLDGRPHDPFCYINKGNLAVIGRHAAVADFGRRHVTGYPAWLTWVFIHIWYLIGFDNKLMVMIQWAFDYFSRKRGARLITGNDPHPLLEPLQKDATNENKKTRKR